MPGLGENRMNSMSDGDLLPERDRAEHSDDIFGVTRRVQGLHGRFSCPFALAVLALYITLLYASRIPKDQ